MEFDLIILLRLTQTLLSLIALALNASVTHYFNTHLTTPSSPPGHLIFLVFTSTWTLLISIPYTTFAPQYFPTYINRYASLAFELLTTVFWFAGWIAGAVYLGSLEVCRGTMCNNARAGVVFAAIVWACFCVTSYFPVKYCFFDGESKALGEQNWRLGMSGAERISRARERRHKANEVRVRREMEGESGGVGVGVPEKAVRRMREVGEVVRVRAGNVIGEWKMKAGRERQPMGISPAEMRERDQRYEQNQNTTVSSVGRSGYGGYPGGGRSVSPMSDNMV